MKSYKEILNEEFGNKKEYSDYKRWKKQAEYQGYKVREFLPDIDGNMKNLSVAKDKEGNERGEFFFGKGDKKKKGGWLV